MKFREKIVPLLSDKEFLVSAAGFVITGFQIYTSPRRRYQLIQLALTSVVPMVLPRVVRHFQKRK